MHNLAYLISAGLICSFTFFCKKFHQTIGSLLLQSTHFGFCQMMNVSLCLRMKERGRMRKTIPVCLGRNQKIESGEWGRNLSNSELLGPFMDVTSIISFTSLATVLMYQFSDILLFFVIKNCAYKVFLKFSSSIFLESR